MKFCVNCGHQLKSDQKFCTNCGAKQPELAQPATPASSVAPVTPQATPVAPTQKQATPAEPPVEPELPRPTSDVKPPVSQASAPVKPDVTPTESPATPSVAEPVTPTEAATSDVPETPAPMPNGDGQSAENVGVSGSPTQATTSQAPQQPGTSTTGTTTPNGGYTYTSNGQFASQSATTPVQTVAKAAGDSRTIWIVVGAIVLIVLGVAGYNGYNTYKRDNLTEQEIANIGDSVTSKYLDNSASVRYSKSRNVLTIEADEDTKLYNIAYDLANGYDETDEIAPYLTNLKKISSAMAPLMPTSLKDVQVELLEPQDTDYKLYTAEDGDIIYDFTDDE